MKRARGSDGAPRTPTVAVGGGGSEATDAEEEWMIPFDFQSDLRDIHVRAGFDTTGM